MNRSFLPFACLCAAASLHAGDPVAEPAPLLSGSLSVGYDSAYIYRGGNYGEDAPWTGADFYLAAREDLILNFGVWYVNPTGNHDVVTDEFDVYSYLILPLGDRWELSIGGTWFYFPEDESDAGELGLTLSRSLFEVCDFTFEYVYDLFAEGNYFGYSLDKVIELSGKLDLNLGTGISHADQNYNTGALAGDHIYAQAGLTFHLSESVDVNTYVLGNFPRHDLEALGEKDDVYGGVSMTVSF